MRAGCSGQQTCTRRGAVPPFSWRYCTRSPPSLVDAHRRVAASCCTHTATAAASASSCRKSSGGLLPAAGAPLNAWPSGWLPAAGMCIDAAESPQALAAASTGTMAARSVRVVHPTVAARLPCEHVCCEYLADCTAQHHQGWQI